MTVKVEKQNPGEYQITGHGQRFWLHHADSRFVVQDLDEKTSIEIKPDLLPALLLAIGETVAEFYELDPTAPVTRQTGFSRQRGEGEICPPDFGTLEEPEGDDLA
jgi:hypothetical protein